MYTEASLYNVDASSAHPIVATLPLPDLPGKAVQSLSNSSSDANNLGSNASLISSKGGFVAGEYGVSSDTHGFSRKSLAWRLIANDTKIVLSPLSLYNESGTPVTIVSPLQIIQDCISVYSDGNNGVYVDFIVTTGFLYTVHVGADQLLHGKPFPDPSGRSWRAIKRPTALDPGNGASPRLLVAFSPFFLIAGLSDGTVVKLERDGALREIRTTTLHDSGLSGGLGGWLRGRDDVPGYPNLSLRTIVCAVLLNKSYLVTYSVDNSLRLWSLRSNECASKIAGPSGEAPRLRPSQYIIEVGSGDGASIMVSRAGELKTYSLQGSGVKSSLSQTSTIELPSEVRGWFLADLKRNESKGSIVAAFKSHMTVKIFNISVESTKIELLLDRDVIDIVTLPDIEDVQAVRKRVLAGDTYHPVSRQLAFEALGIDFAEAELLEHNRTIDANGWLRLDGLCREMEAKGMELLSVEPCGEFLWLVRDSHESLCLASSELDPATAKVVDAAFKLWTSIGSQSQSRVIAQLNSSPNAFETSIVDEIANVSDALPKDIASEFLKLGSSLLDGAIVTYLDQFKEPAGSRAHTAPQLSDTGAAVFARLIGQKALTSLGQLRALAVFCVVATAAGVISNGIGLYARIIREIRVAEAILGLQSIGSLVNALYGAVKILKYAPFETDGYAFLWNGFDLSGDIGLKILIDLWKQGYDLVPVVDSPDLRTTPATVLVSGLITRDENIVHGVALPLALYANPALVDLNISGQGLAHYYTTASKLLGHSLELAEAATRHKDDSKESAEWLFKRAIASGNLTLAYEALLSFAQKTTSVHEQIAQLIDCAARLGLDEATYVIRELPFIGLASQVKIALESRETFGSVPGYKLLYSWYVSRENYVGAAQAVYAEISKIIARSGSPVGLDTNMAQLFDLYAVVLNAMRLVKADRWILVGDRIVTFEDIQHEHKSILQRMADQLTSN